MLAETGIEKMGYTYACTFGALVCSHVLEAREPPNHFFACVRPTRVSICYEYGVHGLCALCLVKIKKEVHLFIWSL